MSDELKPGTEQAGTTGQSSSQEPKPVTTPTPTTGTTEHSSSHEVPKPVISPTPTEGTPAHSSSHNGAPCGHFALREGAILMLFLTLIFGLIGWTVQQFGQLAGERAAQRAVDAKTGELMLLREKFDRVLDEARKSLHDEVDQARTRYQGEVAEFNKTLGRFFERVDAFEIRLEQKSVQLENAAERLATLKGLLEENFGAISAELAKDPEFLNTVVNTVDPRIQELEAGVRRHRNELPDLIQQGVGFGEWVTIHHQKGDPGGIRRGVAETHGWLMVRATGPSATNLRVKVNGDFTAAQNVMWGCILSPVSKGDTWVCEGRTGGNPDSSNDIPQSSLLVRWLPIGASPAVAPLAVTD